MCVCVRACVRACACVRVISFFDPKYWYILIYHDTKKTVIIVVFTKMLHSGATGSFAS